MAIIDEIISAGSDGYKVSEPLTQEEARSLGLPIIAPLNDVLERKYKQYVVNDPDAAAARIWNAEKIGVPRWIQDFDEMYKKEAEARIALKDKGIPNFKSMVSFNPLTANFLSHDDAMEVAHDDSDALASAESAARRIKNVQRGFGSARVVMSSRQRDLRELKIGESKDVAPLYPKVTADNKTGGNFIDNLSFVQGFKSGHEMAAIGNEAIALFNKESFGKMPGEAAWVNLDKRLLALDREEPDGWFSGMFYELGKQVGQQAQGAITTGTMSALGAVLGAAAAVPVAGQALTAAGMTAMAGWILGTRMGIFTQSAKVEGGLDIIQRRRMQDENGNFLDPAAVAIASMTVGSINGALELAQVETAFSPIGKVRIVNKVAAKIARMSSFKKMAGMFVKDVVMNDVTESFTEVLQDLMPIAADEFEKAVFLGGNEQRSVGDVTAQLRDTFTQSLYAFALPSLIGPVGAGVRGDYRAALYSKQVEAMQTQYINRTLDNFSNKIHAAKIIKRIPGMSREFANNLLTDADVSKVYVPAKSLNVLFQDGKLDGDYESAKDWAADLLDVDPEQFEESMNGGPEMEIEAAKLFADMDDSIVELLRPDMRFSRDGLTMREAEAVNKRVEDLTTGQLFDTTLSAEREAKELESARVLFESKRMELEAAGRDSESARVDAISMSYMYRSLTRKYNELRKTDMLPHEFARLYPLQIVRGEDGRVGIYLQSIGEKGAAALDTFNSETERLDNLAFARMLESEGLDALSVKQQTNWERGADGKWRYETDDSKFTLKAYPGSEAWRNSFSNKDDYSSQPFAFLKDIVLHDELLTAYPYLGDIKVYVDFEDKNTLGYYSPTDNTIHLNYDTANNFNETRETIMHEVQHAIQYSEGFSPGGNTLQAADELSLSYREMKEKARSIVARDEKFKDEHRHEYEEFIAELDKYSEDDDEYYTIQEKFEEKYPEYVEIQNLISDFMSIVGEHTPEEFLDNKVKPSKYVAAHNRYLKYAGETEARNTERRMNMTAAERRESLMSATEDVSREDQIVLQSLADNAASMDNTDFDEMLANALLEMNATRKLYSGTKLFGFAPNGNKSNLTDAQWIIVRTPAFKKWFGNWEAKAQWDKVENIEPLEIPQNDVNAEEAKSKYGSREKSDPNKYDGVEVFFVANALQKVQGHKNADLINMCIPFVNELFKDSVPIYVERERNPKKSTNVVGFHNYLTKTIYNEEIYYVRFTVQELTPSHVQKGKGRTELHNLAISNIEVYSQSDINETSTLAVSSGLDSGDTKPAGFVDKNIANWLKDVKSSTSQVVDENGEPLVVYHGTGDDFNEFRKDKLGSRETAFFFTSSKKSAQEYGWKLMPVFINAKRFVRLDDNYRDANGINYNVESEEFKQNFDGYSVDEGTDYDEFVIFDPTNIKSATGNEGTFDSSNPNIYYQTRGGTYRGALIPPTGAGMGQPAFLMLGNAADVSTVMHETAHFYFSVMQSIAADYGSIADLDIVADWTRENAKECAAWTAENYDRFEHLDKAAATEEAFIAWLEDSKSVSPELAHAFGVAQQEYFARGFEAYLREGKAPTAELRGVFQRFKRWLCDIYRSLTELRVNLNDDARGVFDRMLASEEAIESYRFEQDAALETDLDIDIGGIAIFDDEDVYEAAKERLLGELLDDVTPERIKEMVAFAEAERPSIAADVASEPLYAMLHEMQSDESLRIHTGDVLVFGGNNILAKMPDGSVSYNGMPFEMAVKNYGFSSAAEMVESLSSLRPEKEEVDARVRFAVAAKYPDAMSSPDKMDYAAFKALYTGDERQDEVAADIVNSRNLIEEYDKYREIYAADEAAHAAEDDPGSRPNVLAWIKKNGKIKYSVVKHVFGAEPAKELHMKIGPGLFASQGDGFGLDELAQALNSEGVPIEGDQGLFNLLMGDNPERSPIDKAYDQGASDERAKYKKKRAEKAAWRAAQEQLRRDTSKAIKDSLKKPAQEAAKNIVGTFTISAIFDKKNLLGYVKAEKNARRDAEKALRKKDEQGFKDNKQIELRNNAIVREIYRQRTRAEYLRAWLNRYAQRKAKQTFGMSVPFIEQVDAIAARFDLKKLKYTKIVDRTAEVPVKSLKEFIDEQEEQGVAMLIPDWISQSDVRIHYSQLRLQQMEDIRNSVANILKVGRDDKQTIAAVENMKIDEIAADILSHAHSFFGKKKTITGTRLLDARRETSKLDVVCDFLANNETAEGICRAIDGYKDMGPMYKYVFNPIRQALARETLDLNDVFGRLRELHEKCYGSVKISDKAVEIGVPMYKKSQMLVDGKLKDVFTPTENNQLFDREMIVCAILNMGNEQNISRLKMGWGWTDADLRVILDKASEEDIKYVQGVWDILETMWPKVKYVSDLMTGRTLDKVEAKALLTKFGELRGGYYPIITDLRYSERNAARAEKNEALASKPLDHASMHTVSGQRKARGIDVPGSPPLLSFNVLDNHVANTVHDYLLAPAVRDARKILKNDRVSNVISEALGDRYNRNLNRWLNDVAANTKNNGISMSGGSLLCSKLRSGTSMYLLGGNIGGALMQPLGYLPLALRIGPINAARALLNLKPETYRVVYEKSEFMRSEIDGTNYEVRRLRQNWSSHGNGLNRASSAFLEIYPFFQNMCNVPGWYVAYQLGLENFTTEAEAIAYADGIIRQTQSSSSVADLTDFERSGPLGQLLTMFYSWYRVMYQMQTEAIRKAKYGEGVSRFSSLASYSLYVLVAQEVANALLRNTGPDDDDDDKESSSVERWVRWTAGRCFQGLFASIPIVRDVVSNNQYGYRFTPATAGLESLWKLIVKAEKEFDKIGSNEEVDISGLVFDTVRVTGFATGMPNNALLRAARAFWEAYDEDKAIPWAYLFLGGGYRPKN